MKKILIYSLNFYPELTGIGKYNAEMAFWFSRHGYKVRVISGPPYYPAWKVSLPYRWYLWMVEIINGVKVFRCPIWVPKVPSGTSRIIHLLSFAVSSLPSLLLQLFWRPSVVWVVVPSMSYVPSALLLGRLSGAKLWVHIQDYEIDAAFDLGLIRGVAIKKIIFKVESWLYQRFDMVSTISTKMCERAIQKGVAPERLRLVSNWVDLATFEVSESQVADYRRFLSLPENKPIILYSGNMGAKQGLELLSVVARECEESENPDLRNLYFLFCGDGPAKARLIDECRTLSNVRFIELQPTESLPLLLSLATIHLLPQRADAEDLVMPSKLTGMLASGHPVIATSRPDAELARVVEGCGLVVPPESPSSIVGALEQLIGDSALCSSMGKNGKSKAFQMFEINSVLEELSRHPVFFKS